MMRELLRHWGTVLFAVSLGAAVLTGAAATNPTPSRPPSPYLAPTSNSTSPRRRQRWTNSFRPSCVATCDSGSHPAPRRKNDGCGNRRRRPERACDQRTRSCRCCSIAVEQGGDHVLEAGRVFEIAMEEAMANGGFHVDLASGADGLTLRSSDQFTAVVDGIRNQRQRRRLRAGPDHRRTLANP